MPRWLSAAVLLSMEFVPAPIACAQEPEPAPVSSFPIPVLGDRTGYSILPYIQEDALVMHRSSGGSDAGPMNWAGGARYVLGIPFCDNNAIEFGYMGLFGMNADASAAGPVPINAAGIPAAGTNLSASYHSFMQSGELNFRHFFTSDFSLFAGFRYVNWHETNGTGFDPVNPFAGVTFPPGAITQNYHTSNNLYGFQIGGDGKIALGNRFGLEFFGKAGIFGNHSDFNANFAEPGIGPFTTNGSANGVAFVGELGLIGTYQLTDHLKLRAGYEVMWLEGLALAPTQIDTANFGGASSVNNRGNVFLHGAVLGIDFRW